MRGNPYSTAYTRLLWNNLPPHPCSLFTFITFHGEGQSWHEIGVRKDITVSSMIFPVVQTCAFRKYDKLL